MSISRSLRIVCLLLIMTLPAMAQDPSAEYRIGPKDLIEIRVAEVPDLNVDRRVDESGSLDIPLIGAFKVSGYTAAEARAKLEDLLRTKYFNRATVTLNVKEFANNPINVVGAVVKPGPVNVSGSVSLLQALSAAGGLGAGAGRKVLIMRRAPNGLTDILEVNTDRLLREMNPMWNVPIYPADIVNVPMKTTIKIFLLGEVKNPGALEFDGDDRISLLSAIAKAGGLTDRASKTIRIKRRGADGRDVETKVNYKDVLAGRTPDPLLSADDVLIVEESFF
jgi:polysaccharide export outer membrane protein